MTPTVGAAPVCLRTREGDVVTLDVDRWTRPPGPDEEPLLERALAPVLDIGCGPGRHVLALSRRGVVALGVDVAPAAVDLAHQRGAPVLRRSVFDRLPGTGRWESALLIDGNVGIGGDPLCLLRRIAALLRRRGRVLVEVAAPGERSERLEVRVESAAGTGPWFPWARLSVDDVDGVASTAGLGTCERWESGGRWFVRLDRT